MTAFERIQAAVKGTEAQAAPPSYTPLNGIEAAIQASVAYLASEAARRSLSADPYWPKWNSPWWHMSVLHEMGAARHIPERAIAWMLEAIQRQYVAVFFASELPAGRDPAWDTHCHCSLGNLFQVLHAAGVDVDQVMPWARAWFLRYQMPDGGLNCDELAYSSEPAASSIVGTIAPLEAVLDCTQRPLTADEATFLDRGAGCLLERQLMHGCRAPYNAEEQQREADWLKPCFPRLYFYDVLRGLRFVLRWADRRKQVVSAAAIADCVSILAQKSTDGAIRIERQAFCTVGSRIQTATNTWERSPVASVFALLLETSQIGQASPYLTQHWIECKQRLKSLINEKLIE